MDESQTITLDISDSDLKSQVERYAKQRGVEELENVIDMIDSMYDGFIVEEIAKALNQRINELKQD
jgi:hypothetical protein